MILHILALASLLVQPAPSTVKPGDAQRIDHHPDAAPAPDV